MDERSSTKAMFGGYSLLAKHDENSSAPDEPWKIEILKPDRLPIAWESPFRSRESAWEKAEAIARDHAQTHGRTVPSREPVWEEV